MDRYHLWFLLIQLLFNLYPVDSRVEHIDQVLLEAAEDPGLPVDCFAKLMRSTDLLLRR